MLDGFIFNDKIMRIKNQVLTPALSWQLWAANLAEARNVTQAIAIAERVNCVPSELDEVLNCIATNGAAVWET